MSWDAIIVKTSDPNWQMPSENAAPVSMGTAAQIHAKVGKVVPTVEWTAPEHGHAYVGKLSLEFDLSSPTVHQTFPSTMSLTNEVDSIGVSARGSGDPVAVVVAIAKANQWSVGDSQSGGWINLVAPSTATWKEFTGYRDKVASAPPDSPHFSSGSLATNLVISVAVFASLTLAIRKFVK